MNISINYSNTQNTALILPAPKLLAEVDWNNAPVPAGMRKPTGLYNHSLNALLTRLSPCTEFAPLESTDTIQNYLTSYDSLLDSIVEHIEACESISEMLFQMNDKKPGKGTRAFRKLSKPYTGHIKQIVNEIKHKQSSLNLTTLEAYETTVYGYFVDHCRDGKTICAHPDIHGGHSVAISFNRDLRWHLAGVFFVSDCLSQLVSTMQGVDKVGISAGDIDKKQLLHSICKNIASLPQIVFPDEVLKDWITIKYFEEDENMSLKILCPCDSEHPSSFKRGRFSGRLISDGETRGIQMPYMGTDVQNYLSRINPSGKHLF